MAANCSVGHAVYAFSKLFQMLKSHADMEPIQHKFALWCNLAMDRAQASVAVGEDGYRGVVIHSTPAESQTRCVGGFRAPIAHKSKTRCVPLAVEHFARNDFKITFRSLVSGSHVSAVQADNCVFTRIGE